MLGNISEENGVTQGHPVTPDEKKKILELHENGYFPSVIARHISERYPEWCGGYRSTETVRAIIRRIERE